MSYQALLFDLDGTLLDTAPDLCFTLNLLCQELAKPAISLALVRGIANEGSKAMLKLALDIQERDQEYLPLRERFLTLYEQHHSRSTQFFPGVIEVLDYLQEKHIPWGIVTNKLTRHTTSLLTHLNILHRPNCVVCGDTLQKAKPDPAPVLHACQLLNCQPEQCLFVGDSIYDVKASKAAGLTNLVALYGYISDSTDPYTWQADGYIKHPSEILSWLD